MPVSILGISAFYHDSAACLLVDGKVIAAAQEERFTRKKHDSSFPLHAIKYVLQEGGLETGDLDIIAFYDKPYLKFERLLETYHAFAPRGLPSFLSAIPVWIREKLFMKKLIRDEMKRLGSSLPGFVFPEHHLSHAASAFYPSPFKEAAILTLDGVGEWATTTIGMGRDRGISILKELRFPHSIGLLYSAFTYYTGFRVNSGEYKLMGLAPYGNPESEQTRKFKEIITTSLVDIREDGSIVLNMDYFKYATGLRMVYDRKWTRLFGIPPRKPESIIDQSYMNMALAIQQVTEEIVMKLAVTTRKLTGARKLVMAGGVALNSVANGKILGSGLFDDLWIQPAAGDAGGSLGAALAYWHISMKQERVFGNPDSMQGAYLGPAYSDKDFRNLFSRYSAVAEYYEEFEPLAAHAARLIAEGNVVGWFQGRMEFGPRALGNRSILGDARNPEMQKKMNLKIKYREGFRPFAPVVMEELAGEYFELEAGSPYMLLVVPILEARREKLPAGYHKLPLWDKLYTRRSDIPAVTHIDYSARVQTVHKDTNPRFWRLLDAFREESGYGLMINTSFNVRGEPIVCNPEEAYRCFMATEMDYLVLGNYILSKKEQPDLKLKERTFSKD